jgi:uncharacterized membrane protein YdjX (TVP38/TMEM64 family)
VESSAPGRCAHSSTRRQGLNTRSCESICHPGRSRAVEAVRSIADPEEPIAFGETLEQLVPPADATNGLRPLPFPTVPVIVLAIALASTSSAVIWRPEFQTIQDVLAAIPRVPSMGWISATVIALAGLVFIPLELMSIAAGVLFGVPRGGVVALVGSVVAAAIGYAVGRAIGPAGLPRWMSRRSYRSARQLGARGLMGVLVLRLASVATSGSIHLVCGAGRVPFWSYITGTVIGFVRRLPRSRAWARCFVTRCSIRRCRTV